jgi:putative MATE family efflux protein
VTGDRRVPPTEERGPAAPPLSLSALSDPVPRALLRLAAPILASHLLRLAYQWVDAFWVRGLGVEATAAVTSSVFFLWAFQALNDMVLVGTVAYVSQFLGAGNLAAAGHASYQGLRASAVIGALGIGVGIGLARPLFGILTAEPGALDAGASYLRILLIGSPLFLVSLTAESVMRAAGDARTPLAVDATAVGLNLVLDPILIYGLGPIPRLEVAGAALATVIAQGVAAAIYLRLAGKHPSLPVARSLPGSPVRLGSILRVGLPAATIALLFSAVYVAFGASAGRFGPAALAVVGMVQRLEAIEFLVAVAIGLAGSTLVGQNLGAGRPERAVAAIKTGMRWITVFAGSFSILIVLFPHLFLAVFTSDPEAIRIGTPYLRVIALCAVMNGLEIVVAESVLGSGHTLAVSTIFASFSLVRLPLAFLVPEWGGIGVMGIAWVITITCVIRSVVILAWAGRGTWKRGLAEAVPVGPAGAA